MAVSNTSRRCACKESKEEEKRENNANDGEGDMVCTQVVAYQTGRRKKKGGGGRGMIEMGTGKEREWTRASRTCLCFLGFWDGERLDEHFDLFRFDDQVVDEFSLVC